METNHLQQQLFSHLKENLPAHLSLVDELCDLLDLSADSVYRRIRGEKPITLSELKKICEHYHLSLDQLLQLKTESVLFDAPGMNGSPAEFIDYLKAMLMQFKYFNSFKSREIHYLCKDSTIWNFYLFPEMAAFKTFFWSKTINNQASLSNKTFSMEEFPYHDCFGLGQQVLQEYNQIPCVELWNLESMHSTINQVAYYRDAGNFKTNRDFELVLESFHKMIDHLQLQAEKGVKFMPGAAEVSYKAPIRFYINELILGNNTMVINLDGKDLTMVTYSVFHYLFTKDPRFAAKVKTSFDTLLSRSTLISTTGEKDRNRFFNAMREKVNGLRK
ncbi:MAG: hypothetical protein IPK57_19560 [Chitinophagaceae bacterium]|nr:hypothetical protein [Chitinophagaceae bacterium]